MQRSVLLKSAAGLLVCWGLLNLVGGILGALDHPSQLILPLLAVTGLCIAASGIGFWLNKKWSTVVALIGLAGLSLAALYSASILRGWSDMQVSHHVIRLVISGTIFLIAVLGQRRARRE